MLTVAFHESNGETDFREKNWGKYREINGHVKRGEEIGKGCEWGIGVKCMNVRENWNRNLLTRANNICINNVGQRYCVV